MKPYESYTNLSRLHATSVHALKKILAEEGYLEGKVPTAKARDDGIVQEIKIEAGRFSTVPTTMLLWQSDTVARLVATRGMGGNPDVRVWSGHSAVDRIQEAAGFYEEFIGDEMPPNVRGVLGEMRFEPIAVLANVADKHWGQAVESIRRQRAVLEEHVAGLRRPVTPSLERARLKLDAVEGWLSRPRPRR